MSIEGISGSASAFAGWNVHVREHKGPPQASLAGTAAVQPETGSTTGAVTNAAADGMARSTAAAAPSGASAASAGEKPGQHLLSQDMQLLFGGYVPPKPVAPPKNQAAPPVHGQGTAPAPAGPAAPVAGATIGPGPDKTQTAAMPPPRDGYHLHDNRTLASLFGRAGGATAGVGAAWVPATPSAPSQTPTTRVTQTTVRGR